MQPLPQSPFRYIRPWQPFINQARNHISIAMQIDEDNLYSAPEILGHASYCNSDDDVFSIIPTDAFCQDENHRGLAFCIPSSLDLSTAQAHAASPIECLPFEILEIIALQLYPVDRICLALSDKYLLSAIFSRPNRALGQPVWSHYQVPGISTRSSSDSPPTGIAYWIMFAFNCTHDNPPPRRYYCFQCFETSEPPRSLVAQLNRGWEGLPKDKWEYCAGCKRLRSVESGSWAGCAEEQADKERASRAIKQWCSDRTLHNKVNAGIQSQGSLIHASSLQEDDVANISLSPILWCSLCLANGSQSGLVEQREQINICCFGGNNSVELDRAVARARQARKWHRRFLLRSLVEAMSMGVLMATGGVSLIERAASKAWAYHR